jgi:hypothetical protein
MARDRRKPPFWRRGKPKPNYDITILRPADEPKGKRFETLADARQESKRSEKLLRSVVGDNNYIAACLQRCRAGELECGQSLCPICGRHFRRWFIGELFRVTKGNQRVQVYTVLLKKAPKNEIDTLDPTPFKHSLRKRLVRCGLGSVPVIGGFEIVYKADKRAWVLHINLVVLGGDEKARKTFEESFKGGDIDRPIMGAVLSDAHEQLSYILKFTTYHRPHEQHGSHKARALPLNPREHHALLKWMAQFEFQDFLFLMNAKRQSGNKIVLS